MAAHALTALRPVVQSHPRRAAGSLGLPGRGRGSHPTVAFNENRRISGHGWQEGAAGSPCCDGILDCTERGRSPSQDAIVGSFGTRLKPKTTLLIGALAH